MGSRVVCRKRKDDGAQCSLCDGPETVCRREEGRCVYQKRVPVGEPMKRRAEEWVREWCAGDCAARERCVVRTRKEFCTFGRNQLQFVRRVLKEERKGEKK